MRLRSALISVSASLALAIVGCNESRLTGVTQRTPPAPPEDSLTPPDVADPGYVADEFDARQQNGRVDMLWVIDDSESMASDQENLRNNIADFVTRITSDLALDLRIAITTTAVYYPAPNSDQWKWKTVNGRFMHYPDTQTAFAHSNGYPAVLTSEMDPSYVVEAFQASSAVGTDRGHVERGLEAARLALANTHGFPDNTAFVRRNALLSIVVVSDEKDQSLSGDGMGTTTIEDWFPEMFGASADETSPAYYVPRYVDYFAGLKTRADDVHLTAITNDALGPAQHYTQAIADAHAKGMGALKIPGLVGSGSSDWSGILTHLSESIANSVDPYFELSRSPDVGTITVMAGGETIPGGPSTWTYSAADNAVVWSSWGTFPDVEKVVITYRAIQK